MLALTVATICGSLIAMEAHPLSNRVFDRAIQITVGRDRIVVEYTLGLNDLTLATELLSLADPGAAPVRPSDAREAYAALLTPILARGLRLELGGALTPLTPADRRIQLSDHVEIHFTFTVDWRLAESPTELRVTDLNFAEERGYRRIALAPAPGAAIDQSTAAARIDQVPLIASWEMTPEQEDRSRQCMAMIRAVPARSAGGGNHKEAVAAMEANRQTHQTGLPAPPAATDADDLRNLLLGNSMGMAAVLTAAFGFGMAHAVKPGHGKTMVAAYLVGQRGTVGNAVLLGATTALTHTGTVLFVAFMLRPFAASRFVDQETLRFWLTLLSGLLIVWLGGALFWRRLRGKEDLLHVHGPGGHIHLEDGSIRWDAPVSTANLLTLGFSGGLIPCDDAVLLLLAAIGAGMLSEAVLILLAFSAGLASVLVLLGVLVVKLRGFAVGGGRSQRWIAALQLASAGAITAIGVGLCVSSMRM